jgi:hypothetical protein
VFISRGPSLFNVRQASLDGNAFAATLDRFGHSPSGGGRLVHTVHISGHAVRRSTLKRQLGWAGLWAHRSARWETQHRPPHAARLSRRSRRRGCDNGGIHQVLAALLLAPIDSPDRSVQAGSEAINPSRRRAVSRVKFVGLPGAATTSSISVMARW